MIFEVLFSMVSILIQAVLGILPSLPATPEAITDVGDFMIDLVASVVFVPFHFLGVGFTLAMMGALVLLVGFDQIYHLVMWVVRKLPIGAN